MGLARKIILVLLIALSLATGLVKVFGFEQDIQVFASIGFSAAATTAVGVVQVIGGALLIPPATRKVGAAIMALTFVVATSALFASGMMTFGIFSILFIAAALMPLIPAKPQPEASHA